MTINVNCPPRGLFIGRETENVARTLTVDFSAWAAEHGPGTLQVLLQRPGDTAPYPVTLTVDGTVATWKPSETDLAEAGTGAVQLVYTTAAGVREKTQIIPVMVELSLGVETDPPEGWTSWIDQLTDLAAVTEQHAASAAESAENAGDSATDAQRYATDAGDAKNAAVAAAEAAAVSASHYPQIVNGVWYVWSPSAGAYISTGIDAQGEDGVSPTVEITAIQGGHRVVITDAEGSHTFDVMDGVTPDLSAYRTAADQDEIDDAQDEELNNLKSAIGNTEKCTMISGYYVFNSNGLVNRNAAYAYCDYFPVFPGSKIKLNNVAIFATQGTAFYTSDKVYVDYLHSDVTGGKISVETIVPDGAYYMRSTALAGNTVNVEILDIYNRNIKSLENWRTNITPVIDSNTRIAGQIKQSSVKNAKTVFVFAVGSMSTSGVINTNTKNRISTPDLITAEYDLLITIPSAYHFAVFTLTNGAYVDSGWKNEYAVPKGTQFKMQIAWVTNAQTISDPYNNDLYTNIVITAEAENNNWAQAFLNATPLSVRKLTALSVYSQGACTVDNKILGFKGSANDHSTTNDCYIYDPTNNMALLGTMTHNLGHCATADYCEETNTLLTGNGDANTTVTPTIWLVKNAANKITNGGSLLVSDADTFSIDFSNIDGFGCGACFGESSDFAYLITAENPADPSTYKKRWIYKILLGKGANDYSADGYGTYQTGASSNEYNGTAKIIRTYEIDCPGEIQGLKFRNGVLLLSTDTSLFNSVLTGYFVAFDVSGDALTIKNIYELPIYANGEKIRTECEGVTFYDGKGYVAVINSGVGTLIQFPLSFMR